MDLERRSRKRNRKEDARENHALDSGSKRPSLGRAYLMGREGMNDIVSQHAAGYPNSGQTRYYLVTPVIMLLQQLWLPFCFGERGGPSSERSGRFSRYWRCFPMAFFTRAECDVRESEAQPLRRSLSHVRSCGLVIPVPEDRMEAYREWARNGAAFCVDRLPRDRRMCWGRFHTRRPADGFPPRGRGQTRREDRLHLAGLARQNELLAAAEEKMHQDPSNT